MNQTLRLTPAWLLSLLFLILALSPASAQNTYNFSPAGATGTTGPTQAQVTAAYTSTPLAGQVTVTGSGIQQWTVPATGIYTITAAGASGGYTPNAAGGKGRIITTTMTLTAGNVIRILVGQEGGRAGFSNNNGYCGGGGGGTFIVNGTTNTPLLICGGGGGAGQGFYNSGSTQPGVDAAAYSSGTGATGTGYQDSWDPPATGGTGGAGGNSGAGGAGGGGYTGNGNVGSAYSQSYAGYPGFSFTNGGAGGLNRDNCGDGFSTNVPGGFGGGSGGGICSGYEANGGGGGGYSGGGGSATRTGAGGGGGNYYSGTYVSSALNTGAGSVTITQPVPPNALAFDGVNDYVSIPNTPALQLTDNFTIECWFKAAALNGGRLIDKGQHGTGNGYEIDLFPANIRFINAGVYLSGATTLVTGQWYHVAVVFQYGVTNGAKIYLNGTLDAQATAGSAGTVTSYPLSLGKVSYDPFNQNPALFNGAMDEVRIWNRALCQAEILNNMNGELPAIASQNGLAAYYKLDQGIASGNNTAISAIIDASVSANNGTLHNFDLTNGSSTSNFVTGVPAITGDAAAFTNPPPPAPAVTPGGSAAVCAGSTVALATPVVAGYTYQWKNNGSNIGGATSNTYNAATAGNYAVTVTNDCGASSTSATTAVTVNQSPVIAMLTGTNISCHGACNGTATVTANGGTAPYTYTFSPGGQGAASRTALCASTYGVTVSDLNNCAVSSTITLTEPAVLAVGTVTATNAVAGCPAYNIYLGYGNQFDTLSVAPSGGTAPYTYAWSPATGVSAVHAASTNVAVTVTTTYTQTVTDAHNCVSTASYQVKVLDDHCGPKYVGRELNNTVSVCHSGTVICVSPSAVAGHLAHGDCLGTCGGTQVRMAGPAAHIEGDNAITVYPNPAHSSVNVLLKDMGSYWTSYQVTDLAGKLVARRQLAEGVFQDVITIDVSKLVPGLYLIRVAGDNGQSAMSEFSVE